MNIEQLSTYLNETVELSGKDSWILQVFVVLVASQLLSFVAGFVIRKLKKQALKTDNLWDDALVDAVYRPVKVFIWVIGLGFALEIVHQETEQAIFAAGAPIRDIGVIASIGWALVRFIKNGRSNLVERAMNDNREIDLTTVDAVTNILKIAVIISTGLVIMQTLGFSIQGVLAFGGVGGIAIGFAAQDLLANFFGALMIYFDRPFNIGDWIRSPDQEIEGTVERIGWRMTVIRTFDKRPLYIPNATFTKISVENPSRMTHRRIYETIGVRYDDISVMRKITADVKKMLQEHDEIDEKQTLIVNFNAFNESSCDFFVYTFTKTTNWIKFHEVKEDVLLKIADVIASYDAEIAYPTAVQYEYLIEKTSPDPDAPPNYSPKGKKPRKAKLDE